MKMHLILTVSISRGADCVENSFASKHTPKRVSPPPARTEGAVGSMQCWAATFEVRPEAFFDTLMKAISAALASCLTQLETLAQ